MQHGQKVINQPRKLLSDAGFIVKDVPEGDLCCGWAGTYQVLQPELSRRLRDRKVANIESVKPDVMASGDSGCVGNIGSGTGIPPWSTPSSCSTGRPAGGDPSRFSGPAVRLSFALAFCRIARADAGDDCREPDRTRRPARKTPDRDRSLRRTG